MGFDWKEQNRQRFSIGIREAGRFETLTKARKEAYKWSKKYPNMPVSVYENERSRPGVFVSHWTKIGDVSTMGRDSKTTYSIMEDHPTYYEYKIYTLNKDGTLGRMTYESKTVKKGRK